MQIKCKYLLIAFAEYKRIWKLKEDLVVNVKANEARAIIIS